MPSAATGESNKDEQVKYISQDNNCFMSFGTPLFVPISLSLSVFLYVCDTFYFTLKKQLKTL